MEQISVEFTGKKKSANYIFTDGFGDIIRTLRLKKKLKQTDVSEISGMSVTAISKIENNLVSPKLKIAIRIIEAMGYDFKLMIGE